MPGHLQLSLQYEDVSLEQASQANVANQARRRAAAEVRHAHKYADLGNNFSSSYSPFTNAITSSSQHASQASLMNRRNSIAGSCTTLPAAASSGWSWNTGSRSATAGRMSLDAHRSLMQPPQATPPSATRALAPAIELSVWGLFGGAGVAVGGAAGAATVAAAATAVGGLGDGGFGSRAQSEGCLEQLGGVQQMRPGSSLLRRATYDGQLPATGAAVSGGWDDSSDEDYDAGVDVLLQALPWGLSLPAPAGGSSSKPQSAPTSPCSGIGAQAVSRISTLTTTTTSFLKPRWTLTSPFSVGNAAYNAFAAPPATAADAGMVDSLLPMQSSAPALSKDSNLLVEPLMTHATTMPVTSVQQIMSRDDVSSPCKQGSCSSTPSGVLSPCSSIEEESPSCGSFSNNALPHPQITGDVINNGVSQDVLQPSEACVGAPLHSITVSNKDTHKDGGVWALDGSPAATAAPPPTPVRLEPVDSPFATAGSIESPTVTATISVPGLKLQLVTDNNKASGTQLLESHSCPPGSGGTTLLTSCDSPITSNCHSSSKAALRHVSRSLSWQLLTDRLSKQGSNDSGSSSPAVRRHYSGWSPRSWIQGSSGVVYQPHDCQQSLLTREVNEGEEVWQQFDEVWQKKWWV